jgi:DNA uptake protein ComE-like DNA-binding protein
LGEVVKTQLMPGWFYLAAIPGIGWIPLLIAGYQAKSKGWMMSAAAYGALSLVGIVADPLSGLVTFGWLGGIIHLAVVREQYQERLRLAAPNAQIVNRKEAELAQQLGKRIDINKASQDELVYQLNLSILQANKILEMRRAGAMFTSLRQLASYTGIPIAKLQEVEPIINFLYYEDGQGYERWTRVNTLSADEISREFLLPAETAQQLVLERDNSGSFSSLVQLRERAKLSYEQLEKLF